MLFLVNNVVQKMRTRVTNTMSLYKLTNLKQIDNKRTFVNLYKGIVLVTPLNIFSMILFTNNNIKVVIQMHAFLLAQSNVLFCSITR